jgi:hypothetical protein
MKKYTPNAPKSPVPSCPHAFRFTKCRIFDARFLALAASLACLPVARGVILTAENPAGNDYFGGPGSVGIAGDTAIVGAYANGGDGIGSAFLYTGLDSGTLIRTSLTRPDDAEYDDFFGNSVGISGNTAIVGARQKNSWVGAVYVYTELDSKTSTPIPLTLPAGTQGRNFVGDSVGISGDTAIVGASGKDNDTGSAYIFSKGTDWANSAPIPLTLPDDIQKSNYFGSSVGISGDTAIVGANGKDSSTGSAYVFSKGTDWASSQPIPLIVSDMTQNDRFGYSVGISGNTAIVGARGKGNNTGSAYVFYKGADWANPTQLKLTASDATEGDSFGWSVSISGNTAIVGAVGKGKLGAAYVYTGLDSAASAGEIFETLKLTASDATQFAQMLPAPEGFGASVALEEGEGPDSFIVGAIYAASGDAYFAGKAYTGRVSTFMTVNAGVTCATEGISFVSQTDWIVGENTSNNTVTLSKVWSDTLGLVFDENGSISDATVFHAWFPDKAKVTAVGKGVHIGKSDYANNNRLVIQGELTTGKIVIGSATTTGNDLRIEGTGRVNASVDVSNATGTVTIHAGNFITFVLGEESESNAIGSTNPLFKIGKLAIAEGTGKATIKVEFADNYEPAKNADTAFNLIDLTGQGSAMPEENFYELELPELPSEQTWDTSKFKSNGVIIARSPHAPCAGGTPEPSTYALWGGGLLASLMFLHRRRKRKALPQE